MNPQSRPLSWWILTLLSLGSALALGAPGCRTVVPKLVRDTPSCELARRHLNPLVAGWLASEEVQLASMMGERAVVVAYTGCELEILHDCWAPGRYTLQSEQQRHEIVEIASQYELVSQLPLGAEQLRDELRLSGRLEVRATVNAHLRLEDERLALPSYGCQGATHVLEAVDVGAFELVSGGGPSRLAADAGSTAPAVVAPEAVVGAVGDRWACQDPAEAAEECSYPIRVYLRTLKPIPPAPAPAVADRPVTPTAPDDGVLAHFDVPQAQAGKWTLLGSDGQFICVLPCARRVGPDSELVLHLDGATDGDDVDLEVPTDLGDPGATVKVVPTSSSGWIWSGAVMGAGVLGVVVGGAMMFNEDTGCGGTDAETGESNTSMCTPGIAVLVPSSSVTALAGIVFFALLGHYSLDISTIESNEAGGLVQLGPGGISGSF